MSRFLKPAAARRFYDWVGKFEDTQAFYEDPALDALIAESGGESAASVLEFGCGTGRLAERLLVSTLADTTRFSACDISEKMVMLTRKRLARFGERINIWQSNGAIDFSPGAPPFDRIFSTYVLDLLPPDQIEAMLIAAHAALVPSGRLCVASIAPGEHFPASLVSSGWSSLHNLSPLLVGGCRPIRLLQLLPEEKWTVLHRNTVTAWAITSEIVVATPR